MPPIPDMLLTVTLITILKSQSTVGSATGFFYAAHGQLFLITNRHVVIDEETDHYPDGLSLRLHTDPSNVSLNQEYTIALYSGGRPCWREHPTYRSQVDVIAIPLSAQDIQSRYAIKAFGANILVPSDVDISIGEDVLVMGFPLGFHDFIHNLPIVRQATIASAYPVPFMGEQFVLIDGRLHRGTSGSPVVTKPSSIVKKTDGSIAMLAGRGASYLVGVHSATLDIRSRDKAKDEPLGLNCVWFGSLIEEIIGSA